MEKIYMEENNQKNQRKQVVDFSVVMSFVVAIFAIVSLATYGVVSIQGNGISYAAPTGVAGEEFAFVREEIDGRQTFINIYDGNGNELDFNVPLYYADSSYTIPVFCVEHNVPVDVQDYKSDAKIDDYGLLYLLNKSYANGVTNVPGGNKYVETWVTQVAIWMYLYETKYDSTLGENDPNYISQEDRDDIKAAQRIHATRPMGEDDIDVAVANIYENVVKPLVEEAKDATKTKRLTVTADDTINKSNDGKYYETSTIKVQGTPPADLESFDVTVSGIEGVSVVDLNGNKLELENVLPGTEFRVQIPADKVTESVQNLTVNVKGHFHSLSGHYYVGKDNAALQKVVTVEGYTEDVSGGKTFEVVGAPDTGMNTAQTVYFVGLIVLLCGVGIVYANSKPVEVQQ